MEKLSKVEQTEIIEKILELKKTIFSSQKRLSVLKNEKFKPKPSEPEKKECIT